MGRGRGRLDAVVAVVLALGLVAVAMLIRGEEVSGAVRVVDGDSLELSGRRIRLKGIDAPELRQTCQRQAVVYRCGEVARDALREMTRAGPTSCRVTGTDRYGRTLAVCAVGPTDLGAALVRRGLALSFGSYAAEEREARYEKVGLWEGTFESPSDWRRRQASGANGPEDVRPRTP